MPSPLPIPVRWEKVTVYCNCHVRFDYNFYSVSYQYIKCQLWLCASETTIKIYDDHQLIACHVRCREKGNHITVIDHLPPNAQYYFIRSPQWCREQSEHIGQSCHQIVTTLLDDPTIDYTRAAQGILTLSQRYGVGRLEKACERALYFCSGDYKTVKTILEKSLDKTDIDRQCSSGELASVYCGSSKYLTTHTSN